MLTNKEFLKLLHDVKDIADELVYFKKHIGKLQKDFNYLSDKCDKLYKHLEEFKEKDNKDNTNA